MGASKPADASKLFEVMFAEGDLDGLMTLYEEEAVFATPHGGATGPTDIRAILKGYIDSGADLVFKDSVDFQAGDLALVHWNWTMKLPDGKTSEGATAEVLRRQPDGTWKFVIDNPDGAGLIDHE